MAAGVHFFALADDEEAMLDHLGEPESCRLFPWAVTPLAGPRFLDRKGIAGHDRLGLLDPGLGEVVVIRSTDPAFNRGDTSGAINEINWQRLRPRRSEGLIDTNRSPVLMWRRGGFDGKTTALSELGSQADSMAAISEDYARWAKKAMGWVRRTGDAVWRWEGGTGVSDYDVELPIVNTIYALPAALEFLRSGGRGRSHLGSGGVRRS